MYTLYLETVSKQPVLHGKPSQNVNQSINQSINHVFIDIWQKHMLTK